MSETLASSGVGGELPLPLPSHLTQAQVARHLDITPQAVAARQASGSLPSEKILGTVMIPTMALVAPFSSSPTLHAFTPSQILDVAWDAVNQLSGDPDRPIFSARQLLGVYLGLSRLPYPPPSK